MTPLDACCSQGHFYCTLLLLDTGGIKVTASAILAASTGGHAYVVYVLLDHQSASALTDEEVFHAALAALAHRHLTIVGKLLTFRPLVVHFLHCNGTLLTTALQSRYIDGVLLLLRIDSHTANAVLEDGMTPLHRHAISVLHCLLNHY